jgi:transposase
VSKERVIVLSVVQQHLSKAEAARRYEVSWRCVHTLVTRYQACGWEAVEARSRRPHSNSRAVNDELRERRPIRPALDASLQSRARPEG